MIKNDIIKISVLILSIMAMKSTCGNAQDNFTVKGHLKDLKNEPVPFANVALYDSLENLVNGAASDISGDFILTRIKQGIFKIQNTICWI